LDKGTLAVHKNIFKFDCSLDYVYDYIDSNLDSYFKKSGDNIACFIETLPDTKFAVIYENNKINGWIQYKPIEDTMVVITAYKDNKNKKGRLFSIRGWDEFKSYSKRKGCKKIRMKTARNHKIMQKLYNFKTIERVMEAQI